MLRLVCVYERYAHMHEIGSSKDTSSKDTSSKDVETGVCIRKVCSYASLCLVCHMNKPLLTLAHT